MNTPEGWAAATMLFHTLKEAPPKGSHKELILQLYILRQEYHRSEETKMLTQASLLGENGFSVLEELWKEHIQARFPWFVNQAKQEKKEAMEVLKAEVAEGPRHVVPLLPTQSGERRLGVLPPKIPSKGKPRAYELRSSVSKVPELGSGAKRRTRR